MFDPVEAKPRFSALEEVILAFWREQDVVRRSFQKPSHAEYVFFEGPPTANGRPGIHHVSARAFKDLYPRFKTMQGFHVDRRGGWDTHGLPVEVEIEKEIGSRGKQDIERYGVGRFNQRCRESVFRYIQEWHRLTERIAFWIDLDRAYVTYTNEYMETCWWLLKQLWDRGLLYEDYKVTMHCPRCNSTLADHEVSQGMREDVDDPSIWPKFAADVAGLRSADVLDPREERPVWLLPWTTTPWTLPANTALAVRGDAIYTLVEAPDKRGGGVPTSLYVVAKERVAPTFEGTKHRIVRTFAGAALQGITYQPLLHGRLPATEVGKPGWRVVLDDMVEMGEGTGVVHIAPAYGDLALGQRHRLPTMFSVDLDGTVLPEVRLVSGEQTESYTGLFFKNADRAIQKDLNRQGLLFRAERVKHAYPMCWRDDSPLLFYAKTSWYIRTTAVKDKLLKNNSKINWVPAHVGAGRFGRWLENNVDWALSRERYWGCPLPVWETEDRSSRICVGSVAELSALVGRDLSAMDLHRPFVDEVVFEKDGRVYRRVPYVIDVWFESGAMPYAQWHYPFAEQESFERQFPADFICEALDQTRGWFYSLHALATLLTDTGDAATDRPPGALAMKFADAPAFRTCVVLGFVNDAQGRKMSKSRGNTVDPWTVIEPYGSDALRWYLYSSGPPDQNKNFEVGQVVDVIRRFFLTLWNAYGFFVTYARIDAPDLRTAVPIERWAEADRWLTSRLQVLVREVEQNLEAYDATAATRLIEGFVVEDLSQWYVRSNRRRFWKSENDQDKQVAYQALHRALTTVAHLMAPMAPFLSEALYQNLARRLDPQAPLSVHLADWPKPRPEWIDERLLADMDLVLKLAELGRASRAAANVKLRQPLEELIVRVTSAHEMTVVRRLEGLLLRELNVKRLRLLDLASDFVTYTVRAHPRVVGRRLGKDFPAFKDYLTTRDPLEIAENVRAGRPTRLDFNGQTLELEPEAFQVDVHGPAGYAAVENGGYLAAVSTDISPELKAEGLVRDLVRVVQNARKNAGFAITDRIRLGLRLGEALRGALILHKDYLCQEALVEDLHDDVIASAEHTEEVQIDGEGAVIALRRVSTDVAATGRVLSRL